MDKTPEYKIVLFIQSGGTKPAVMREAIPGRLTEIGPEELTVASWLRLEAAERFLENIAAAGTIKPSEILLVLSGEATRKSGPSPQAEVLEAHVIQHFPLLAKLPRLVLRFNAQTSYAHVMGMGEKILLVMDDVHLSRYLLQLGLIGNGERLQGVPVNVRGEAYREDYPPPFVAAYNMLAYMKILKGIGIVQLVLFAIDRAFHRPSPRWWQRAILFLPNRWLRKDLRG